MSDPLRPRTGGQILIDQLKIHGVDTVFGVPGESYLAALDALYDARNRIRFIVCRQEGGACNMAEAYGKLTGRPGVCFVTRGPGATNASIGLHTALQDSTPLILLIGQVARDQMDREAFQEIDYRRMLSQVTKWVVEIDDARRIPELVSQAFHRALSGRAGPVAIALPEDMLTDIVAVADAGPYKTIQAHPGAADLGRLREMLPAAQARWPRDLPARFERQAGRGRPLPVDLPSGGAAPCRGRTSRPRSDPPRPGTGGDRLMCPRRGWRTRTGMPPAVALGPS
jgi:acetolactate synthase I/II/III large subunit